MILSPDPDRELLRAALAEFERLADLDSATREHELALLAVAQPAVAERVGALLVADGRAHAAAFLTGEALADATTAEPPSFWTLEAGARIGAYRLERPLGSGGMGEVWLARRADGHYEGRVALKFLHPHLASSSVRERFVREGQILARLAHPCIARLLDAGVSDSGRLYLVLEYVEGERVDHWCDSRRLKLRSRLELFLQVCDAVAHAHAHLVLHRDLKPSNILVADDGVVKLLDFGVAKLVVPDSGVEATTTELTAVGGRAFTPEYAAPEQVVDAPATIATDVYALGVLLFGLLTGRRPYAVTAKSPQDFQRAVLEAEPLRLSAAVRGDDEEAAARHESTPQQRRRALRGDLEAIVARCLRKAPGERYATVPAFWSMTCGATSPIAR